MPYRLLAYQTKGPIGFITLDRPQVQNALNLALAQGLEQLCQAIKEEDGLLAAILTGAGDAFCVGEDLQETGETWPSGASSPAIRAIGSMAALGIPTIAAIKGMAFGAGLELALACDLRIAAVDARFAMPQVAQGTLPQAGGTQRLSRIVGRAWALELVLLGETIDAQEAHRIGLVHRVVPQADLLPTAEALAQRIAEKAPIAVRYVREAVQKGLDGTLEQGLRLEADLTFLLQTTEDRMEGIRSFLERRTPQFKGQ